MLSAQTQHDGLTRIADQATAEVAAAWGQVSHLRGVSARNGMLHLLPAIVSRWAGVAVAYGVDLYQVLRDEAGATGSFTPIAAPKPDSDYVNEIVRWGVGPMFQDAPDPQAAFNNIAGGAVKAVAKSFRDTIAESSVRDDAAVGWQRHASAGACTFCRMLAGRGYVYRKSSARFSAHNDCTCTATPAFGGQPLPVHPYTPSEHDSTPEERQAVYAWLRKNTDSLRG